jgi:hypothetical protein
MAKAETSNVLLRLPPPLRLHLDAHRGDVPLNTAIIRLIEKGTNFSTAHAPARDEGSS